MMRKILISIIVMALPLLVFPQLPIKFKYQSVIRGTDTQPLLSQALTIKISILLNNQNGEEVYSENHNVETTSNGLAYLDVGNGSDQTGTITESSMKSSIYFIELSIEGRVLSCEKLNSVPYAQHANSASEIKAMDHAQITGIPDRSNWDKNSDDDFSGSYNDLSNLPSEYFDGDYNSLNGELPSGLITTDESNKIDLISLNQAIDLDDLQTDITSNLAKISTPEFGNTNESIREGDAYWKNEDGAMIYHKNVLIGFEKIIPVQSQGLSISGGIQFAGTISNPAQGTLFYDASLNSGTFCYYDGTGGLITLNSLNNDINPYTSSIGDNTILDDFIVNSRLAVGASIPKNYVFTEHVLALVDNIMRIRFIDTSSSASFPTNDWGVEVNGIEEGSESYFSFIDYDADSKVFKILANSLDNNFYISDDNFTGIGTDEPTAFMDVIGNVKATRLIGNASRLTNLSINATSNTKNLNSTTIGADSNEDELGSIQFQTKNIDRLTVNSNGNIGISEDNPSAALHVNGKTKVNDLVVENLKVKAQTIPIERIPVNGGTISDYDLNGKSLVILNPTVSSITISSFLVDFVDYDVKEITFLNKGNFSVNLGMYYTYDISSNRISNLFGGLSIHKNESVTILIAHNKVYVTEVVD